MKALFIFFFSILFMSPLFAQIPHTISYQGVLTDTSGNPKPDGNYSFKFSLYENKTGGNAIWSESKTLTITKGLFSTLLGDKKPFSDTLKFDKPYWLGIEVGSDPELTPRITLTSAGYSFTSINSDTARNVANGKVVKSINGLKDNITLSGGGGTTVNKSGDTIRISSSSEAGGIQKLQNSDGTIGIKNSSGPNTTLNLKVPLKLSSSNTPDTVFSSSSDGVAIKGTSSNNVGVLGIGSLGVSGKGNTGVYGLGSAGSGIYGESNNSPGVWGYSTSSSTYQEGGVYGEDANGVGVNGNGGLYGVLGYTSTTKGIGVYGESNSSSSSGSGVEGYNSSSGYGVFGQSTSGVGVLGIGSSGGAAIYGDNYNGGWAGYFYGKVHITGDLDVGGSKNFKIDDPLDPANKYLVHSCIESPDRLDVYSGNITTDANGTATVKLPAYFQVLNINYRYQLTTIGQQAQAWIERKIQNNQFTIKTDKPDVEVSWEVTGVRNDPYAKAHPMVVEQNKEASARGKYVHPELYGQPEEDAIGYVKQPEIKQPDMKAPQTLQK